jgi:ketosteroid isomerase-like protein
MSAERIVTGFVEAINAGDVARLAALMTEEHVFIDSDGSATVGRDAVAQAWSRYLELMQGYRVTVRESFIAGDIVVLVGIATGFWAADDRPGPRTPWSVPAAWRARVDRERVATWQIFVNPEPILAARPPAPARVDP